MKMTEEQQKIVDYITSDKAIHRIVAVSAVSGAGKTSLLAKISKLLNPDSGLYICYNKAIATESNGKFSNSISCMTTHSLAYGNTVRPFKLKVGFFTYRNITEKIPYDFKVNIVNHIDQFCLSEYVSINDYIAAKRLPEKPAKLIQSYLNKMQQGTIDVSHSFYLKLYHILLAEGHIEHEEFDILMLDEAGDLNPVTLEIFKLLPAKRKIMVGDENQNIYSFNNTINGFETVEDLLLLPMTQSFRVAEPIAKDIEQFCKSEINPKFVFKGVPYDNNDITTRAFISRTNGVLISKMIELNSRGTEYNLVRPPRQIFNLLLTLISLKPKGFVSPEFKHLQEATDDYYSDYALRDHFKSLFAYLLDYFNDDINLRSAINTIAKHGAKEVIQAFELASSHVNKKCELTLCTAHSSKGLEFDSVEIGDDCNTVVDKARVVPFEERENHLQEEIRLYYVACTRAKKELLNARHLKPDKEQLCQNYVKPLK